MKSSIITQILAIGTSTLLNRLYLQPAVYVADSGPSNCTVEMEANGEQIILNVSKSRTHLTSPALEGFEARPGVFVLRQLQGNLRKFAGFCKSMTTILRKPVSTFSIQLEVRGQSLWLCIAGQEYRLRPTAPLPVGAAPIAAARISEPLFSRESRADGNYQASPTKRRTNGDGEVPSSKRRADGNDQASSSSPKRRADGNDRTSSSSSSKRRADGNDRTSSSSSSKRRADGNDQASLSSPSKRRADGNDQASSSPSKRRADGNDQASKQEGSLEFGLNRSIRLIQRLLRAFQNRGPLWGKYVGEYRSPRRVSVALSVVGQLEVKLELKPFTSEPARSTGVMKLKEVGESGKGCYKVDEYTKTDEAVFTWAARATSLGFAATLSKVELCRVDDDKIRITLGGVLVTLERVM